MPLHPDIKAFFDSLPKTDEEVPFSPERQREIYNQPNIPEEERVPVYKIEDRVIPAGDHEIPIRIYTPHENGPYPLMMYFHGGGFLAGSIDKYDEVIRPLAVASGYKVIAVGYRLAPEYPFPHGLNDCYEATKWVAEHMDELDGDGKNLAVCGDSAGGNLSAAVSLMARDKKEFTITKQVLFYPSLDLDVSEFRYPSLWENDHGYGLQKDQLADYYVHYLKNGEDPNHPYISPVKAKDFSNLPSALVVTAELDPLRDEGELYAKQLKEAGVYAKLIRYPKVIHGFLGAWTHLDEYKDVYDRTADFLNDR